MSKANEPAYPTNHEPGTEYADGLTKRELIAAMAMQGILNDGQIDKRAVEYVSDLAVQHADALLSQLKK